MDEKDRKRIDFLRSLRAMQSKMPRATGEVPYSGLPSVTSLSDDAIFSVVDNSANAKITKADLLTTLTTNLFFTWDLSTTPVLNISDTDLKRANTIYIEVTDSSFVANGQLVLDPAWDPKYASIKIKDKTDRTLATTASITTSIKITLGTTDLNTFYFFSEFSEYVGGDPVVKDSLIYDIQFEIIDGEFRNPYGIIGHRNNRDSTIDDTITGSTPNIIPNNVIYKVYILFNEEDNPSIGDGFTTGTDIDNFTNFQLLSNLGTRQLIGYGDPGGAQDQSFPKMYGGIAKDTIVKGNYNATYGVMVNQKKLDGDNFQNVPFTYSYQNSGSQLPVRLPTVIVLDGEFRW